MEDKIFEALASAPRRQILRYLTESDMTASDIAANFEMSKPAISKHLSILENAGLIRSKREGQYIRYQLVWETLVTTMYDFLRDFRPVDKKPKVTAPEQTAAAGR